MKPLYFGKLWWWPDERPTIIQPPPMQCFRCHEPIAPEDSGLVMGLVLEGGCASIAYHRECHLRMIVGSLGHQMKRCSCYGGTEEDPPNMTRREAAKAAADWAAGMRS